MKYANGTQFTRTLKSSKFQYYEEDCICKMCIFYCGKSKSRRAGCELETCCCADIRADAIAHGRIRRERGWNKE
jgi:hypothetical protein